MADFLKKEPESDPQVEGGEEDEDAPVPEEESTATFQAKVHLEEVETKTGEEDEEILYSQRSKLYVYSEALLDKGSGTKQWLERGIGDIKLLKHKETGVIRVLLRQEKTLKIIANHALDFRYRLESNVGSDKGWVWAASDFSNGVLEDTTFAIKFKDSDLADTFKATFEKYQKEMKKLMSGDDASESDEDVDDAADALAGVSVKGEEGADEEGAEKEKEKEKPADDRDN